MTILVIVESPNKVAKIKSFLGTGYEVMASVGHIRDLPSKGMGVEPPNFTPQYEPTERGKEVIERLKRAARGADRILLATDPDREGEAIAWHIGAALGLKISEMERVTFNEITESKVLAAIKAPRKLDTQLVGAQETRRVLDRIIGFRVSPALSDKLDQALSAGRVQSPAVRIIVDREREIKNFSITNHYGAELAFQAQDDEREWTVEWDTKPLVTEDKPYILDEELAEKVSQTTHLKVIAFEDKTANRGPAAPFTTSTLQQIASKRLKINPKKTMELAQELFAGGHITYHRTDAPNISEEGYDAIARYAEANRLTLSSKRRKWKAKEGAQEGHEAIRPTHPEMTEAGETEEQKALYRLIWQRAIASQIEDAVYAVRSVRLEGNGYHFSGNGRTLKNPGWMKVYANEDDEEEKGEINNPIPSLKIGENLAAKIGRVLFKKTAPPKRYTEASLVAELERRGIGRPSTFAAIIENITGRSYVNPDKKGFLIPSSIGEIVRDALVGRFQFINLDFTRQLEEKLDEIAQGREKYRNIVAQTWQRLDTELAKLEAVPAVNRNPCPKCKSRLRRIKGKNGFFWGCSNKECDTILPDDKGKPGVPKAKPIASGFKCPDCGNDLVRRQGKKGKKSYDFYACLGFPKCKKSFNTGNDGKPKFF